MVRFLLTLFTLFLAPLALAVPPLGAELVPSAAAEGPWQLDVDTRELAHEHGEAVAQVRNGLVTRVSGAVDAGLAGANALTDLVVALHDGDDSFRAALEHHLLGNAEVPPFTRVENTLLTLREQDGRVAFDYGFIEFAATDFRASRHALNPEGSVPVRLYSDMGSASGAAYAQSVLPQIRSVLEDLDGRLEYHHAPLAPTGAGVLAAEASECVAAAHPDSGFWAFHDEMVQSRTSWSAVVSPQAAFLDTVEALGLSAAGLEGCISDRLASREVSIAAESARNLGFSDRPTVFVGGVMMADPNDLEELAQLVRLAQTAEPAESEEVEVVPLDPADSEAPANEEVPAEDVIPEPGGPEDEELEQVEPPVAETDPT